MPTSSPKPETYLDALPAWARELSEKYYSRTLTMFVLHGNVRDLALSKRGSTSEFLPLQRFLRDALFGARDLVLFYEYFHGDTGRGVGAAHQTGWTGLVAKLLMPRYAAEVHAAAPAPGQPTTLAERPKLARSPKARRSRDLPSDFRHQ